MFAKYIGYYINILLIISALGSSENGFIGFKLALFIISICFINLILITLLKTSKK